MVVDVADYGWRRWLDARTSRGGPYDATKQSALHRYFLFPNTILNILPSQMTIYTSWPVDAERCRLEYRFCVRPRAGRPRVDPSTADGLDVRGRPAGRLARLTPLPTGRRCPG